MALGPHPQRELTPMLAFGGPCPQARMAAGATSSLALGPHPQRELTLTSRLGFPSPRLDVAAGATSSTGAGAPPPARTDADARLRRSMSSGSHGRRRYFF